MSGRCASARERRGDAVRPRRLATALVAALCAASSADAEDRRLRFLVLHDSHSGLAANVELTAGMTAAFDETLPGGYELYAEYRDGERFPGAAEDRRFAEEIVAKYAGQPIDVLITMGPGSLAFAVENAAAFAPETPVVFGAVTRATVEQAGLPETFSGVVAAFDLEATLRLARDLQPGARRVAVLSGSAPFDRSWEATARETLGRVDGVRVDYVSGLTIEGFVRFAADAGPDTILIALTIFADAAGERFVPRDAVARIAAQASAPV